MGKTHIENGELFVYMLSIAETCGEQAAKEDKTIDEAVDALDDIYWDRFKLPVVRNLYDEDARDILKYLCKGYYRVQQNNFIDWYLENREY